MFCFVLFYFVLFYIIIYFNIYISLFLFYFFSSPYLCFTFALRELLAHPAHDDRIARIRCDTLTFVDDVTIFLLRLRVIRVRLLTVRKGRVFVDGFGVVGCFCSAGSVFEVHKHGSPASNTSDGELLKGRGGKRRGGEEAQAEAEEAGDRERERENYQSAI